MLKSRKTSKIFLEKKLNLELSDEKTLITNTKRRTQNSSDMKSESTKQIKQNGLVKELLKDTTGQKSLLKVSMDTMKKKLFEYDAIKLTYHNGKREMASQGKALHEE